MIERRFLVVPSDLEESAGGAAVIRDDEHHHLKRVLRLGAGDAVSVFDGSGRGFRGTIETISADETLVRLLAPDERAVEPSFEVTLLQGLPQHDRMDLVIQKTTEIGVSRIVPIVAERTVARAGGTGSWKRLTRWRRVAAEAARQSGRLRVPAVEEPATWEQFAARLPAIPDQVRVILDPEGGMTRGADGLRGGETSTSGLIAVGPEGGWSASETEFARSRRFTPVSLGPRVLRTETAAIVAVTLCLFLAGEMTAPSAILPGDP